MSRPLVYITGPPGSGKTTVCVELKRRGFEALDTDDDGIAFFYDNETGEPIKDVVSAEERTPEWRERYAWKAKRETVAQLRECRDSGSLFLCGVTANDVDELWDLFSTTFALIIEDPHELKKRLAGRGADDFGQNPHELGLVLRWQKTAAKEYKQLGAVIVDASKPIDEVADTILSQVKHLAAPNGR